MAYTVGSAKDARKDPGFTEQEFLNRFNARKAEILAYKKAHGGDLEGAYRKVTGEPWPEGRSVKVHGDGRVEMTKDRTIKSVLGKYVALPAAYTGAVLATGGASSPLLFGLGGGTAAGSGAASAAALEAGATIGIPSATAVGLPVTAVAGGAAAAAPAATATAAAVAPGVVKTAAGGGASWFKKALPDIATTAIQAGAGIVGTKMAADASAEAARIQAESYDKGLEFEKKRYDDIQGRLAPYFAAGQDASRRTAELLRLPAFRPASSGASGGSPAGPVGQPGTTMPGGPRMPEPQAGAGAGGLVTIQAPNGRTKQVPQAEVDHYVKQGARVLQGAA